MVKLSDYLNYLYKEVIQARIQADKLAIQTAKEYAKDEYLRYFKAPRYTMPTVKLEIPVKISEIDDEVKYDFKMDNDTFLHEVNSKIENVNTTNGLNLKVLTKKDLETEAFKKTVQHLEVSDQKFVKNKEVNVNKIDFSNFPILVANKFKKADMEENDQQAIMKSIIREAFVNRYRPVSADLKNIFIDPNTMKETDKGKMMVMLNIELVDEGVQIKSAKDKDGNQIEEIIID